MLKVIVICALFLIMAYLTGRRDRDIHRIEIKGLQNRVELLEQHEAFLIEENEALELKIQDQEQQLIKYAELYSQLCLQMSVNQGEETIN